MELDDLKSNWQESESAPKKINELLKMTKISNHPKFKRIRIKLLIEFTMLILFISVYNDAFDGSEKSIWVNLLLITTTLANIIIDMFGYNLTKNVILANNLVESISLLTSKLKKYSIIQTIGSVIFGVSLLLFFNDGIIYTFHKKIILAGMIITLILTVFILWNIWRIRIRNLTNTLNEYGNLNIN